MCDITCEMSLSITDSEQDDTQLLGGRSVLTDHMNSKLLEAGYRYEYDVRAELTVCETYLDRLIV